MALRKPFVMSSEGFHEEVPVTDSLDVGAITINASGTGIDMNSKKITNLADGTNAADGVNLAQVEALVATGNIFKEPVHAENQLVNGASGGIAALEVIHFVNTPVVGDTVVFNDGTLTRTYSFVANIAGESAATDVSIETSAATAMQRLITRVMADAGNTAWDLYYHASGETGNEIHVIERKTPVDAISTSRIYGVWTTQADFQVVPFSDGTTAISYNEGVAATAPTSDPGSGRFGFSRAETTLVDGEVHLALDLNAQFSWEDSAQSWNQISGVGAIPDATSGSGGGTKGLATFDSDKGLQIISGAITEVKLESGKGIQFESGGGLGIKIDDTPDTLDVDTDGLKVVGVPSLFKINGSAVGANVTAANLGTLVNAGDASSLHNHVSLYSALGHSHTHASTTGQTANDHHNQVHGLVSSDHTVSGLTSGHVLTALSATTFGFASPGAASKAPKISSAYTTATDTTANGDAVYINGNDTFGLGRADTDSKARVTGIVQTGGGAAPTTVEVVSAGPCAGVLSGATAGTPYYLQATGGIGTSLPGAGNRVICVGYALNATDLFVRITDYGKKAA